MKPPGPPQTWHDWVDHALAGNGGWIPDNRYRCRRCGLERRKVGSCTADGRLLQNGWRYLVDARLVDRAPRCKELG